MSVLTASVLWDPGDSLGQPLDLEVVAVEGLALLVPNQLQDCSGEEHDHDYTFVSKLFMFSTCILYWFFIRHN